MYEESYRTPLLARWPGVIKANTRNDDLVQNIDFAETFLELAGLSIPEDMQGESLLPLMKGYTLMIGALIFIITIMNILAGTLCIAMKVCLTNVIN